MKVYVAIE
jgi:hypothetical protein